MGLDDRAIALNKDLNGLIISTFVGIHAAVDKVHLSWILGCALLDLPGMMIGNYFSWDALSGILKLR